MLIIAHDRFDKIDECISEMATGGYMKPFTLLYALGFAIAAFLPLRASAVVPSLKITEMTVTTKIYKGDPIDSVKRLSAESVKGLYCFTRVESSANENTTIKHIWYLNGELAGEVTLPIKGEHWRTYSKKTIDEGTSGTWRVDAVDGDGNLLKTVKFIIN
jgi:hypothetical protein